MSQIKPLFICLAVLLLGYSCRNHPVDTSHFVKVEDGRFVRDGKPYYYVGMNFWYAGILASEGENGNRTRLLKELDYLKEAGVNNLRVMVGADGPTHVSKVEPSLQTAPGVYNDTLLAGLDYLLQELGKRNMVAVLYFNNTWEWTGGYSQYLEWAGYGNAPVPAVDGYDAFAAYVSQYMSCAPCAELFMDHITHIITRTNSLTGVKYTEDPAIMAWQIGNEPRPMGANNTLFEHFTTSTAKHIKSLDPNHLVSIGSEGLVGTGNDTTLYRNIHRYPQVDYFTFHIWPKNWEWINPEDVPGSVEQAIALTNEYIDTHIALAIQAHKPIVLSEFGYPRDNHLFTPDDPVTARNTYYQNIFDRLCASAKEKGVLAGCNIWAWGGFANPAHVFWLRGDDLTGDPKQEEQGLNSVFAGDNTMNLIQKTTSILTY